MNQCPVCSSALRDQGARPSQDARDYDCPRCGKYSVTGTVAATLRTNIAGDSRKVAVLSHAIRRLQRDQVWPMLDSQLVSRILAVGTLPKPAEQANNLLLWLAETLDAAEGVVTVDPNELLSVIGGQTLDAIYYVASHLQSRGLISLDRTNPAVQFPPLKFSMKFDGWEEYEQLRVQSSDSRIAFMAMQFNDARLDAIVDNVFRPAVAATGFELRVLTDVPRAGLIDDRLRVEIRKSRFLLADVTHRNPGAYWEAGFAEGLGKPVIYTCDRAEFRQVAHFDTNHHLTVMWDEQDTAKVAEELKATIRATLPTEARLGDNEPQPA